jgi:putative oxidoreductase
MKFGRLLARAAIGGLFVGHGTQKWFGWFDGPGLDGTAGMMDSLGMKPGRANAHAASAAETVGGAAIVLGAFTPAAAAALIATMITAIRTVHLPKGPWAQEGGYEYNVVLIASLLLLVDGGPGDLSVDNALGLEDTGAGWALAALAAGAAGSTLAMAAGKRFAEREAVLTPETTTPSSPPPDTDPDATEQPPSTGAL